MAWTTAKQTDGTLKHSETLSTVSDGDSGYSSTFSLAGLDFITVLTNEVSNSTVTLEVAKEGSTVAAGGVGLDPSAASTDTQTWAAIAVGSGAVADNTKDIHMVGNATEGRFKVAASGGDVDQEVIFYTKGTAPSGGFSVGGIGTDPS